MELPSRPLLSVCVITYNQEDSISEALNSILSQKVDFDFEVVVGEDCGADGTLAICQGYQKKYPEVVRLLPSIRNYGVMGNLVRTLNECFGTYIAICEGDDYWIDSTKLSRQVALLEADRAVALTFHPVYFESVSGRRELDRRLFRDRCRLSLDDVLVFWSVRTCSVVFRKPATFPDWYLDVYAGDKFLTYLCLQTGQAELLDRPMAVHRVHENGVTGTIHKSRPEFVKEKYLEGLSQFNQYSKGDYSRSIRRAGDLCRLAFEADMASNPLLRTIKRLQYFRLAPFSYWRYQIHRLGVNARKALHCVFLSGE